MLVVIVGLLIVPLLLYRATSRRAAAPRSSYRYERRHLRLGADFRLTGSFPKVFFNAANDQASAGIPACQPLCVTSNVIWPKNPLTPTLLKLMFSPGTVRISRITL